MKFNNPNRDNTAINNIFDVIQGKSAWGKKQLRDLITPVFSEQVVITVTSTMQSNANKTVVLESILSAYIEEQIGTKLYVEPKHFNEQFRLLLAAQTPTFSIDVLKQLLKVVYNDIRVTQPEKNVMKTFKYAFQYLVESFERDMGSVGYKLCYTRYLKYLAFTCNHYLDQGE